MNVRSVTCFVTVDGSRPAAELVRAAGKMAHQAKTSLESAGYPVQTVRLATQPIEGTPSSLLELGSGLAVLCADAGFDYLSIGPVSTGDPGTSLAS